MVFKLKGMPSAFPCLIDLERNHNHSVQALQASNFKDIPPGICYRIKGMFYGRTINGQRIFKRDLRVRIARSTGDGKGV